MLTNKYLKYSPKITLEIFTLVWNKLIDSGWEGHLTGLYSEYNYFKLKDWGILKHNSSSEKTFGVHQCMDFNQIETTVQELLEYDPYVKEPKGVKSDGFILPEKWQLKVENNENKEIISNWRKDSTKFGYYKGGDGYLENSGLFTAHKDDNIVEITFDQFKQYVLKSESVEKAEEEVKQPLKQAIHCTTQEEWDFVLSKFNPMGLSKNKFMDYKENSVIVTSDFEYNIGRFRHIIHHKHQILSFQEWCDLNGYKSGNKIIDGKWYKKENNYYIKCHCHTVSLSIISYEVIYNGKFESYQQFKTFDNILTDKEVSIEEIQKYLPAGHPDLITKDKVDVQSEFKVGDFVKVIKFINGDGLGKEYYKINEIFQIHTIIGKSNVGGRWIQKSPGEEICSLSCIHATSEEINNHLIYISQTTELGKQEPEKYPFKPLQLGDLELATSTTPYENFRKFVGNIGKDVIFKSQIILSIDDEELPMVNIIKTKTIKQLSNND